MGLGARGGIFFYSLFLFLFSSFILGGGGRGRGRGRRRRRGRRCGRGRANCWLDIVRNLNTSICSSRW